MNVTLIYLLLRLVQSDTNVNNMNAYTGITLLFTYCRSNFTYTNTLTQTESIMRIQIVFP